MVRKSYTISYFVFLLTIAQFILFLGPVKASYLPLPDTGASSNIGIGTFSAYGGKLIVKGGNMGIGTLVPSTTMDVMGTARAEAWIGNGTLLQGLANSSGFVDSNGQILANDIADNVGIGTSTASNGKLMVYGGNVGIGTVNQTTAALLHVSSKVSGSLMMVEDDGDLDGTPFYIDANGNVGIGTRNVGTAKMAIFNGNLGIGTWNPAYKLDVVSYASGSETIGYVGRDPDNTQSYGLRISSTNMDALYGLYGGGGTESIILDSGGNNVYFQTNSTQRVWFDNWSTGKVNFGTAGGAAADLSVQSGNLGIGTWTAADGSRVSVMGGNVGIYTTLPGGLLVVKGNVGLGTAIPRQELEINNTMIFSSEYDNGTCTGGGTITVTWGNGQNQKVALSDGACTINFSATSTEGVAHFWLKVISGGASSSVTFGAAGATITWPAGIAPTISASNGVVDMVKCFFDGSVYYCKAKQNF